jgi:hypothetical protein
VLSSAARNSSSATRRSVRASWFIVTAGLVGLQLLGGTAGATGAQAPDAPTYVQVVAQTSSTVTVSWAAAAAHDAPVTGYAVERSTDDRVTWSPAPGESTTTATNVVLDAPPPGKFYFWRVIANSEAGPSAPSDTTGTWTEGTATQRFVIKTADGVALTNGDLKWSDGYGTWSKSYSLSPDGVLLLPNVHPGGSMTLRMDYAELPSGVKITKSWSVDFGTDSQTLLVPPPPDKEIRRVHVLMPNGVPIVAANVDLGSTDGMVSNVLRNGFFYSDVEGSQLSANTDASGIAVLTGWSAQGVQFIPPPQYPYPQQAADIYYDDGVLFEEDTFLLTGDETTVQLDPMPWLTTHPPDPTGLGSTTPMVFSVRDSSSSASLAGKKVSVVPPTGWSAGRCSGKSTLTGKTNSLGRLTLRVCASKSGYVTVNTAGVVPTGSIPLRVRRTAPMVPARLRVSSTAKGQLTASWNKPLYAGGRATTSYRIVVKAPGEPARQYVLHAAQFANGLTHTFTHLARAERWRASVQAVNPYGTGDAATASAQVL